MNLGEDGSPKQNIVYVGEKPRGRRSSFENSNSAMGVDNLLSFHESCDKNTTSNGTSRMLGVVTRQHILRIQEVPLRFTKSVEGGLRRVQHTSTLSGDVDK